MEARTEGLTAQQMEARIEKLTIRPSAAADAGASEQQQLVLVETINQLTESLRVELTRSAELQNSVMLNRGPLEQPNLDNSASAGSLPPPRQLPEVPRLRLPGADGVPYGPQPSDRMSWGQSSAATSIVEGATVPVPRLRLPEADGEPYGTQSGARISWVQSSAGTLTVESTPCNSIDRPWLMPPSGVLGAPTAESTPCNSIDCPWLVPPSEGSLCGMSRPSMEFAIGRAREESASAAREELMANPRYASLLLRLEGENSKLRQALHAEKLRVLNFKVADVEEENLKLGEALNAEKQRVHDLKVADQNRRQAWKHEMTKIEMELAKKQALEERCQSFREYLSLFVMHIQEPISAVLAACEELAPSACPRMLDPVEPGAQDGEYVGRLTCIVEVLRFFARARRDWREGQQGQGREAELACGKLCDLKSGARRGFGSKTCTI